MDEYPSRENIQQVIVLMKEEDSVSTSLKQAEMIGKIICHLRIKEGLLCLVLREDPIDFSEPSPEVFNV